MLDQTLSGKSEIQFLFTKPVDDDDDDDEDEEDEDEEELVTGESVSVGFLTSSLYPNKKK
jgi:hypothetical protein